MSVKLVKGDEVAWVNPDPYDPSHAYLLSQGWKREGEEAKPMAAKPKAAKKATRKSKG